MKTKLLPLLLFAFTTNAFAFTNTVDGVTNNGDGTVTDNQSGLVWQACAIGQTFNASTGSCDGKAEFYYYKDALKVTSDLGGYSDWRFPSISELISIVDLNKKAPSINKALFPNAATGYFWSSTSRASADYEKWYVNFDDGSSSGGAVGVNKFKLRFVRSVSTKFSPLSINDFIDNGNGTVTHTKTGLTWQRCAVGQTWANGDCSGTASLLQHPDALLIKDNFTGKTDWRLPSYQELLTIVDYSNHSPSTSLRIFPNTSSDNFWVSNILTGSSGWYDAWFINFKNGGTGFERYGNKNAVRLVSGNTETPNTQPAISTPTQPVVIPPVVITPPASNVDLTSTISANLSSVNIGSNLTYTATIMNKGTTTANNVSLVYMMPPRWTNFSSIPSGCSVNGANVTCSLGSVNAGSSVSNSITVNFSRRGATSVGALVKTDNDTNNSNNSNNMNRIITTITKY